MNRRIKKKVSKRKKIWYNPNLPCPVVTFGYRDYKFMHKKNQDNIINYRRTYGRAGGYSYDEMLRYLRRRIKSAHIVLLEEIL